LFLLATGLSLYISLNVQRSSLSKKQALITTAHEAPSQGMQQLCENDETETELENKVSTSELLFILPFFGSCQHLGGSETLLIRSANTPGAFSTTPVFKLVHNFRI
jgi:hypothetical protein